MRKFEEANIQFDQAVELASDKAFVLYDKGFSLHNQGKIYQAIEAYHSVLVRNPYHVKALNNLGVCLSLEGRLVEALDIFNRALSAKPNNEDQSSILRNQAVCQAILGRFDEADVSIAKAVLVNPKSHFSFVARGRIEWFRGNYPDALKYHRTAQRVLANSNYKNAYMVLPLLSMGKTRQAIHKIREWLATDPWPVERYSIHMELHLLKARFPETSGINEAIELVSPKE